ncbi:MULTISPECIES: TIGR03745 family integrating conjugative element membrane protein [Enterobacterales]|uniref:TIGR03745 family integrating conjugative element membrane protein n=1 Tax=Enterobacterales TaxID=91347 RepID=UPI0009C1BE30|nr:MULTISPECIES: TIGR03745 family integrating conjugative element membrane protein [Serratia]MBL0873402.1 TIGR03745 family integrating conjugative element membrane protein [Serratia nevei]SVK47271.1 integrating conjugative element membrane protein, PFL_4702 family [Acinetobacter baumannii]AQT65902.1 integrating conjugative element membrane protein [Serratia marcescens]AWO77409.1 TIGR03745 family integrating conjugative element membrane protein [Serratia marcescens]EGS9996298.1 TIGR03745 family
MNAAVRLFRQLCARAAVATSLAYVTSQPVQAALPSVEPPSSGGGGGLMDTIKGYFQDGIVIIGLVAAAVAFLIVANAAIHTFAEVRDQKATWAKFGAIVLVGVVLLVTVIWLVGKSAEILF